MKINQLTKLSLLKRALKNSLGYFSNGKIVPFYYECAKFKPLLVIVARKHYVISHKSYPALSLTELKAMLKITHEQHSQLKPLIEIKINKEIDGFDVKTITFQSEYTEQLAKAWCLIPETEILTQKIDDGQLYQLHTPSGLMFFSQSKVTSHSVYQGGLIQNAETYKHSIGMADAFQIQQVSEQDYLNFLADQFNELTVTQLLKISSVNYNNKASPLQLHALYWGPLLSVTLYLGFASAFQWFSIEQTDQAIISKNESANELLAQKQQLDTLNNIVTLFNQYIAQTPLVLSDWEIINKALNTGMTIDRFSSRQGQLRLIGESENANITISKISSLPQVKSAIFSGGVRKYRGTERFEIEITLWPSSLDGVKP